MYGFGINTADTRKYTEVEETADYIIVSCSMRNVRPTNEDRRTVLLSPHEDRSCDYFAVLDGHGGAEIAHSASQHLHEHILTSSSYRNGDVKEGLIEGFLSYDHSARGLDLGTGFLGSTASVIIIKNHRVYAGSVGDSRVIAIYETGVVQLTHDHRPWHHLEKRRIEAAGLRVIDGRVNGQLAMSRSLGDFYFKSNTYRSILQQAVIARPSVGEFNPKGWKVVFMATDGVWEVLSIRDVASTVRSGLRTLQRPEDILEGLIGRCSLPRGEDNCTAIMIIFKKQLDHDYIKLMRKPRPGTKTTKHINK